MGGHFFEQLLDRPGSIYGWASKTTAPYSRKHTMHDNDSDNSDRNPQMFNVFIARYPMAIRGW